MKPFIIAEAGINHNGDINIAKKLIDGAKSAGADAIKFQKRTIDRVYSKEELNKYRESPWGKTNLEQKMGLEFGEKEYSIINEYCKELKMEWFASPWDLDSVDFLMQFKKDLRYMKIPSALMGHTELLEKVAKLGLYTFISTGMCSIENIGEAIMIFQKYECSFELMHCNSTYPTKDGDLNLLCIPHLHKTFDCKVGYSGHSAGIMDGVLAYVLGATSIEKHITIDRTMYGTDQPASLEIHGLAKMIEYINFAEMALGDGDKKITDSEQPIKNKLYRTHDYK